MAVVNQGAQPHSKTSTHSRCRSVGERIGFEQASRHLYNRTDRKRQGYYQQDSLPVNDRWREIWGSRSGYENSTALERAIQLDGFDNAGDAISAEDWRRYVHSMAERMRIRSGASVFEVGCGAGAFLIPLHELGTNIGGIDYSPSLIKVGRSLLPSARLKVCDALDLDVSRLYDHVFCHSVFQYLENHDIARQVLNRMILKSRRSVGILDVSDAALREQSLSSRRASASTDYDAKYIGLEHLYIDRVWFAEAADELGCTATFYDSDLHGHRNSPYRYSVVLVSNSGSFQAQT